MTHECECCQEIADEQSSHFRLHMANERRLKSTCCCGNGRCEQTDVLWCSVCLWIFQPHPRSKVSVLLWSPALHSSSLTDRGLLSWPYPCRCQVLQAQELKDEAVRATPSTSRPDVSALTIFIPLHTRGRFPLWQADCLLDLRLLPGHWSQSFRRKLHRLIHYRSTK